jgi:hypothetical protein
MVSVHSGLFVRRKKPDIATAILIHERPMTTRDPMAGVVRKAGPPN